jgi:hypothetical protein
MDSVLDCLEFKVGKRVIDSTQDWVEGILETLFVDRAGLDFVRDIVVEDTEVVLRVVERWTAMLKDQNRFGVFGARAVPTRDLTRPNEGDGLLGEVYIE